MFDNCNVKYVKDLDGSNCAVQVTYQDGSGRFMSIPLEKENTDYQNILAWVDEGNTIEEGD